MAFFIHVQLSGFLCFVSSKLFQFGKKRQAYFVVNNSMPAFDLIRWWIAWYQASCWCDRQMIHVSVVDRHEAQNIEYMRRKS